MSDIFNFVMLSRAVVASINNINDNGFTTLDILMQIPVKDLKDVKTGDLLKSVGALITREQTYCIFRMLKGSNIFLTHY